MRRKRHKQLLEGAGSNIRSCILGDSVHLEEVESTRDSTLHIDARYSAGTWSRIESFTPPLMLSVAVARGNSSVWLVPSGAGYR